MASKTKTSVASKANKFNKEDTELLQRALRTLIWFEEEKILSFARGHIYVPDGNGGAKKFEGPYKDLVAYFDAHPEHGRLHSFDQLDRLKKSIDALHQKLFPGKDS